jgi:homoserine dehydrogenase
MAMNTTKIGLLGFGTVGRSVFELLDTHRDFIAQKMRSPLEIKSICVRDMKKDRGIDKKYFTTDYESIAKDPEIDIVVELMGDCPEALAAIKIALKRGNSVVTANKALVARHAIELFRLAKENHAELLFEASVGGGIPVLRALREGLAANRILSLRGIINGTSNYILSKMTTEGVGFDEVLKQAQKLGYAEADPAADIDGIDAAYKLCILVMLCHGKVIRVEDIFTKGIRYVTPLDIKMADNFGYVIKLLGITKTDGAGFEARVHPAMVKKNHPLAHVDGAFNAVQYEGDFSGIGMMYGSGAGGSPTASAVVGDIIELNRNIKSKNEINLEPTGFNPTFLVAAQPNDVLNLKTCYYLRFSVLDKPQVLANITRVLGQHGISIRHLYQHGERDNQQIPVIVFTHLANERDVRAACKEIDQMDFITQITKLIRIEDHE